MKRFLGLILLASMALQVGTVSAETTGPAAAKERLKAFGSAAFSVGGALYLLSSYYENKKFDQIKDLYSADEFDTKASNRAQEAGKIEGSFNVWRGVRYVSTGAVITGSFLLGMSLEDSFNLI